MSAAVIAVLLLTLGLAAVNGGNDVAKGVATLAGAGVARYRTAVAWGMVTTLPGSLLSFLFAARMTALFSKGIVSAPPTVSFAVAVLVGAIVWVGFATGAIADVAGRKLARLNGRTLRDFAVAWTLTPLTAGLIAASCFAVLR